MLKAYFRARSGPGGQRLMSRGNDAVVTAGMAALADVDPDLVNDLDTVLLNLVYGLLGRFAVGEIDISDVLPTLDKAVFRMTSGSEGDASNS
jgi:TetR/AcrR family transcriptional regulator, cholesterol catabolism regulator